MSDTESPLFPRNSVVSSYADLLDPDLFVVRYLKQGPTSAITDLLTLERTIVTEYDNLFSHTADTTDTADTADTTSADLVFSDGRREQESSANL